MSHRDYTLDWRQVLMEEHNRQHDQIIDISGQLERGAWNKQDLWEAPCGFSDAGASNEDAKELSVAIRKLLVAVALCVVFMSGVSANSLAILTDTAHLLSDIAAFAISLFSLRAAGWEATPRQIEILGALVSIQLIWLLAGVLVCEAIVRLIHDTHEVTGFLMFAAFGLVVKIIMALVLGHGHGHGLHDRGNDEHDLNHAHRVES
ncbi:LOW QUALITY PROTEIN: hypothetical protein RJ640_030190 [Escallonia rubra]|uniref:Cation efflux protein transmembrane domain-containing protein n=1 Tax=Escallonia rubra TaxID=112253 RepID=A0AA88RX64_9ASTE|nr:LOW QUALITY PROTEIN: hypothetical protein RJ640_030190 [Escallonia rubra]